MDIIIQCHRLDPLLLLLPLVLMLREDVRSAMAMSADALTGFFTVVTVFGVYTFPCAGSLLPSPSTS